MNKKAIALTREKLADGNGPVEPDLRKHYPELEFLFQELDDFRHADVYTGYQEDYKAEAEELADQVLELEDKMEDIRKIITY